MHYSVLSSTIISTLAEHNITAIDSSDGVVIFKKNCSLMGKSTALEAAFLKKFQELSPKIIIDGKPKVISKTALPADFKRYQLESISIPDSSLKKSSGTFSANFKVGDKIKKIYFNYELKAMAYALKAKHNLHNGKIIQNDDFEAILANLDALPMRAFLDEIPPNASIKGSVKEGHFLNDYNIEIKKELSRKSHIKAVLKEDGIKIEVMATLLDDANIGDTIKIRTEQGNILNAKVVSVNEAIIIE